MSEIDTATEAEVKLMTDDVLLEQTRRATFALDDLNYATDRGSRREARLRARYKALKEECDLRGFTAPLGTPPPRYPQFRTTLGDFIKARMERGDERTNRRRSSRKEG